MSDKDLVDPLDDEKMLSAAATCSLSSRQLSTDSNSAFNCGYQRTRVSSSGTAPRPPPPPLHRPSPCPYRLRRCSSEHRSDDDGIGADGLAAERYRSCSEFAGAADSHPSPPPPHRTRDHPTSVNPLQRKDIFYGGSVVSLRGSATLSRLHSRQSIDLPVIEAPEPVQSATETPTRSLIFPPVGLETYSSKCLSETGRFWVRAWYTIKVKGE